MMTSKSPKEGYNPLTPSDERPMDSQNGDMFQTNWEDILAMMDRRSETLKSAQKTTPQMTLPSKLTSPGMSQGSRESVRQVNRYDILSSKHASHDLMSSTGLPVSAFVPVSDDEISAIDDYEGAFLVA